MTTILSIPEEIGNYLSVFQSELSKPQYERFTEQIIHKIIDEKPNPNRTHKNFFHSVVPSTSYRFLRESPLNDAKIEMTYFSLIRDSGILPKWKVAQLDDTISHKKYAKTMEGVGKHHDHLNNTFSYGHDIVTIGVQTNYGCLPLAAKPYVRQKDVSSVDGLEFKTKNKIAKETLKKISTKIKLNVITMDSWYGNNTDLLLTIKNLNSHFVAAIKSNRNITIKHKKQFVREYFRTLDNEDYGIYTELKDGKPKATYRLHKANVFISQLRSVDLLISQRWDEDEKKWSEPWYIITNLKNQTAIQILCLYLKRNPIECFHREAKQNLGLETYKLQKYKGIVRHLFLVIVAYALLLLMMYASQTKKTIAQMCEHIKKCCETVSFQTVIHVNKSLLRKHSVLRKLGMLA